MKIRAQQMAKAYDYPMLQKAKPFNNPSTTRHLKETDPNFIEEPDN